VPGIGKNRNEDSFSVGTPGRKEYQSVNGRIILKWILEIGWKGMDWINRANDSNR